MVTCKNCGYVGPYTGRPCPLCENEINLTQDEIKKHLSELNELVKEKEYEEAVEGYRTLADSGYTEGEIEYARILEKGQITQRDLDLAMDYFYRAARKNNAYAAYRYSRLMTRENDDISYFWLVFSAILGCIEAYPLVADKFSEKGYEEDAQYFYSLAALCDDTESIVKLAKRYYEGIGTEKSEEYAKWYMDKLKVPPIYAIKLAYKLRNATAKEPPTVIPKNYDGLLHRLKKQAKEHDFGTAYLKISEILAEKGDGDSMTTVGIAHIEGSGFERDLASGLKMLTKASAAGNISAHIALADLYAEGEYIEKDMKSAFEHYTAAGKLGSAEAYETVGDIYCIGEEVGRDIATALDYYDLAAALASPSALQKADEIRKRREALYKEAVACENSEPDEAFRLYTLSCSMGHIQATFRLAVCFEFGIGTAINRHGTFLLYKKSVELGVKDAVLRLGFCYARGFGIKLNYPEARNCFEKAMEYGIEGADQAIIAIMERKKKKLGKKHYSVAMRLIHQKKFDIAKTYLDVAAELMNPRAIYTLGCLYEFGMGAPCDKDRAFDLYEQAYSMFFRDPRAEYKLAVLRMLKAR